MYTTNDGRHFWASSERELVKALQDDSYTPTSSTSQFMNEVSRRTYVQTGRLIRTGKIYDFVADLVDAGLLIRVQSN